MLPQQGGASSAQPGPGLEGHLRNLILSNAPTEARGDTSAANPAKASNVLQTAASITPKGVNQPQPFRRESSGNSIPTGSLQSPSQPQSQSQSQSQSQRSPQQPRAARKRPNQAQRRQMNSQLSIPIDPRPQQLPPSKGYHGHPGHSPQASSPVYQRHTYSHSHPRQLPQMGYATEPHLNNQWNGNRQQYGQPPPHARTASMPPNQQWDSSGGFAPDPGSPQSNRHGGHLYQYRRPPPGFSPEEVTIQASLLDRLCFHVVSRSEIQRSEIMEKENFRCRIEAITREVITKSEREQSPSEDFPPLSVELKCFGSLSSGFATRASDMDLGLISPNSKDDPSAPSSPIPRLLEKAFLDAGLGARLLTRTRVPIIKVCENPPEKLLQDLLAERLKWENGLDNEGHDAEDEDLDPTASAQEPEHGGDGACSEESPGAAHAHFTVSCEITGEPKQLRLKQGRKHSLSTYYGLAKRVLRRCGGRDVTISNLREFSEDDWAILNRVCKAFVLGLADTELRDRLARYPSLSFTPSDQCPTDRSLLGVLTQIEGEQITMLWEKRVVKERTQAMENQAEQTMRAWQELQLKPNFGVDPVSYSKELQLALEKVKRLPSVLLVSLEQTQHELPAQYYSRTCSVLMHLQVPGEEPTAAKQDAFMKQYVSGIYQDEIRVGLQSSIEACAGVPNLKAVARRHKSLHLAWEFQNALDKDLYKASDVGDVQEYIALLRSPLLPSNTEFIITMSSTTASLLARIQTLPDPHKMAPNQPRDRYRDRLEFPKTGAGVQCDINFSAHLALQNTLLLRCYSHTDPRVRPMVLFIKQWAKIRGINSGYRGTLSSYGYVLMVLHYLVNVAQPFVSPNLQQLAPTPSPNLTEAEMENTVVCKGFNIQFWRNENEILHLAHVNQLTRNTQSLGHLLRGFFEYFAQGGPLTSSVGRGFDWGRDVLSLRSPGGLLSKQEKGWTGAKTVVEVQRTNPNPLSPAEPVSPQKSDENGTANTADNHSRAKAGSSGSKGVNVKEVRYRYLFAIEDPFELGHNVARTVTHNGIVSIRDEFRRAWGIIRNLRTETDAEELLREAEEREETSNRPYLRLLAEIHSGE